MVDFVEYIVSELKSRRLDKANALELIRQFSGRRATPARLHPLLHLNVSTLTRQRYRTQLTGEEFFLRDHRVRMPSGAAFGVLPGVAYLEMARAAVADAVPELATTSLIAFENVLWLSPFAVEGERAILIELDADEDLLGFTVFSETEAGHRTDHASGRVRFHDPGQYGFEGDGVAAPLDLAALRDAMRREHWDADTVYRQYARIGIEYGPAHRGIVALDSGDGQVLADLALPDALAGEDNAAYILHPSLIDSALQAAIGLGGRDAPPADPMLPFAMESLCILGDCAQRLHAFVRRADSSSDDSAQITLDLDLCDANGNVCVQMRGFCARRFAAGAAATNDSSAIETLVAVPRWSEPRPRGIASSRAAEENLDTGALEFAHVRVLLCDYSGVDPAALSALRPGRAVESLSAAEATHPALRYEAIALQVFEHLQDVLKRTGGETTLLQCVIADTAEGRLLTGLGGMLRTAALENPALTAQLVVVQAQATPDTLAADLAEAAAQPQRSPLLSSAEGWRSLDWTLLPQTAVGAHDAHGELGDSPYREDGVYLITGGLGGLGGVFARDILDHAQRARVVLTGRSAPDRDIAARLDAYGFGDRLHYRQLDLDDAAQCRRVVEAIADIGALRGVLHCAGARSDNLILKKTAADVAAVLAPKVRGTWHLDDATADADLDFFALFSSGVSAFGNVGQADYAAANGFLDAFADFRQARVAQGQRSGRTLAIDWPLWDAGGMRPDADGVRWLQAQTGMLPMRSASGIAVFRRALASAHAQVLTVEGDGLRLRRLFDAPPAVVPRRAPARLPVHAPAMRDVDAPFFDASAVGASVDAGVGTGAGSGDLRLLVRDFLRRQFAPLLKIAPAQIDIDEALESYGINSILAMSLTAQLEKHLGPLPKTLFFEYQTVAALGEHLAQAYRAELQALLVQTVEHTTATNTAQTASVPRHASAAARPHTQPPLRGKSHGLVRRAPSARTTSEPIAIVGLSGRYPEAETPQDYWRNLRDGKDCVVEIPESRWRWQDYYTSDREQPGHYSKWGGFIQGADEFDAQFFNISPREAPYIDPQERLFLQHAWMAIEDAGYSRKSLRMPQADALPGQVGVYAGVMYGEYNRSGSLASIANRVSYALNLHGPSMTLDTMCSSSLTAIHLACQDLKLGRTDMALAGGVNLSIHPDKYSMLSAGQFISSDGHCQSFGEGGDGYIPGEGVGVVVLKRLSDAQRDGDAIHAVIRGSALNHGGKTNGYTVPNPQAQAAVISAALKDAGVDARHISYIEAHGTGTKLGDPIEIAALGKAFREHTADTGFCLIGSAKSNIGHCESAAGIAGLTKVILQMRHRQIAPSLHSQRLNPNIDFAVTPFEVNQSLRDWDAPVVDGRRMPRIAGLSSFGAGGANAHFVIEEPSGAAHAHTADATLPGVQTIVPLSARTSEQLLVKGRNLLAFLQDAEEEGRRIDHASLAYTLQVGREPMEERLAFVVDSAARLQQLLRAWVKAGAVDAAADGAYRGNLKAHREMLGLFAADPDYEEALDKWIAQRKLAKLAELWAKGFDLDWRKFHGRNAPTRMHLPTYPFAKDRYWIDPVKGMFSNVIASGAASRTGAVGAAAGNALHPLLHENTSDLDQLRYSSLFQTDEPFVVGHSGGAGAPLPSSVLLDMARVAVACAKRVSPTAAAVELSEVRFASPFVVDGASALHIALYPSSEHDGVDFDIFSGEAEEEYVHAQGRGRLLPMQAEARTDADRIDIDAAPAAFAAAPVLEKPGAIVLPEPAAVPAIVGGALPKPNASRLPMLDATTSIAPTPAALATNRTSAQANAAPSIDISPNTASQNAASSARDVLGFLKYSLAQALYLDEATIDDDRPFVDLGLDSIVGVEWVKNINKGLGLDIGATRVYDYSNLTALSAFVESQLPAVSTAPAAPVRAVARPASVVQALPALAAPALVEHASSASQPTPVAQAVVGVDHDALKRSLRMSLAQALYLDEAAIDDERSFVDLGLDSIVGVEWVKMINKAYGLEISATRVYDYSTVQALARFLQGELASRPQPVAPAPEASVRIESASAAMPTAQRETPRPAATSSFAAAASFAPRPAMPMPAGDSIVLQRRSHAVRTLPQARPAAAAQRNEEKIAIVGMSGRYPGADDLDQLWSNLAEGRNSIREIPPERWDVDAYYDPTPGKPGKVYCKWLGMLDGAEHFDPMFFQISPAEAEVMDPQHRLFMQESYRAFQDAGYSSAALSDRKCGVYMGIMSSDYSFLLAKSNPQNIETTSNSFAIGAARIAYHLNLKGPAIPIDTACSSSLVATHLACQALLNHEIDIGLAGGVSLYLIAESYLGMCRAGMLASDGQCKTFDNGADGFVPGEGVGTLVLKRLSDAERDGDRIHGVIIGSGINQDGKTNGITAPSVNSQIELLRDIYRRYEIDASSIDYVETHGTGTKLGDPIELEALSTVFKEHGGRKNACALGAIKTNLGHTSGAAGVAGVHKVLLSLRNKALAPNVNLRQENALFDFAASPFYVSRTRHDWPSVAGRKRRAAVSAFGFSGTNAHVVIEEYVPALRSRGAAAPMEASPSCIVPLSARTAAQLMAMAQDLLAFLDKNAADEPDRSDAEVALRDLAYTLQIGRDPMRERCAWVADSVSELRTQLREFVSTSGGGTCHRGTVSRAQDTVIPSEDAADALLRDGLRQSAALAALWAQGAKIEWPSFYADYPPQRLHGLPGYPFAKERYWPQAAPALQPAPTATPSAPAPLLADSGEEKRSTCYAPVWRDAALPAPRAAFGPDDALLIIDTDDQLFEQIKARLHTASPLKTIVLVRLGDAFRQDAADHFCVDAAQAHHFEALLETLRSQGRMPTRVIHNANAARLSAHADGQANPAAGEAIEHALHAGIDPLFGLCRALAGAGARQAPCAFVSFFHAGAGTNSAPCEALAAFYRSLALENNRYHGRVLSIEHDGIDPATSVIDTVTALLDELQTAPQRETEVRYRTRGAAPGRRSVRTLALQSPERVPAGPMPLKHGGTYLITGGLGGLGIVFARHLAEHYRARLAICGRSALDERVEEVLEELRALGAEAVYLQADIAEAEPTRTLIADVKARFGALNGVLHSAGVNDDALLIRKDRAQFRRVLAPKVQGTVHLDRFTTDEPLDLFVLFSSGAGSFGNVGQTDYAYANAFMDAFADHREAARARRARYGRTLSIGWPYWQAGGMQLSEADLQRTEERTGLCALPTRIGLDYWDVLLRSGLARALALYGHPSKIAAYCDPSSSAIAAAQAGAATIDRDVLLARTRAYLCELVHAETRIPADRIDIEERFEAFGFDSIMIGRLNAALEHDLGDLPKTLMYEYETVAELAAYLVEHAAAALTAKLAGEGATQGVADAAQSATDATPSIAASTAMRPQPAAVAAPAPDAHIHAEPIAIIGVHASFPQADDMDALWAHLRAGTDLIEDVPENRWDASSFYDPDPAQSERGKIYCKRGGFLEDFDKFDAGFFNIADAEADIIDPQERRFLQSAWSAIEDAGYTRERLKQRYPKGKSADVGVFVGVTTNSYQLLAPEAWQRGRMVTPGAMPWSIANRVSYALDLQGPSLPVDTACSSSLVAVHLACESLRRGECQLALAGGVNLYLHPAKYQSFCHRRMLAVGDACRSYGAGDDGFIPGEGVGTLVLKPLRLAERDGDRIYGVIRGSAYDHSGRSSGYATPNPNAQAQVIAQALAQAGVPARSIGFIEGHGTGTRMGDSLEVAAITQAFALQTADTGFCALASLKANIGHAESATSIAGIAKILMQFKHQQIAPSIHAQVVNPDIDFAHSPCVLQASLGAWETTAGVPRRALINAFGAGGVNACAVLEEYVAPESVASAQADAPIAGAGGHLFVLSAMNVERLREYAYRYVDFLALDPGCDLAALCRTAQIGREAMPQRLALIADSAQQLRQTLQRWLDADPNLSGTARLWQGSPEAQAGYAARGQRERMQTLCAQADLAGLAEFWTQGGKVEWPRLHDAIGPHGAPLRPVAGAPVYPFARDRHWAVDFTAMEAAPASTPPRLHPLISHNASTLERVCFDAALVEDQYYARDHKVHGQAVFPGAGFVEMACIAATVAGKRRVRRLKDIYWVQPLSLTDPRQDLKIGLSNATGDSVEFAVTTVDDDHESVLHCEGRALFDDRSGPESSSRESLPQWRQRCGESHAGERYYELFQRLGFDYGQTFRVIDEVAIGNGCALAKLVLAPSLTKDFEQYVLHPCLIDGALQTVVALLAAEDGGVPHLPFAIDEIEILGSLTPRCVALVERSGDDAGEGRGALVFNVHILSESGETLVKITNFYLRALVPPPSSIATSERARLSMAVSS
ncbi:MULTISPECIES: SDR family NAD(P)-dependent oxidoreductase [unclassified Lysobacter]|uniref:SDR family NAD(P)-dependent oxidoreductase n=1 Tax=unclassified Lysobacter TaxID=2635362 RepID=UPI001BECCD69|nr:MULTISPECIES: SDR family NAD(P)-dependent oxidoreductase [unclassified Lysobacter]MBT2744871.1 SDR family NAD(P)-dependent oxidoreductase [Lysobacter sp. ISL-42]MBT2752136.1 SDR family NAD(P)-dependent oxidoreductase [Lysobacter sp. ISL-50]MBT2778633.1 SDR family NAD(P)-dependent oxidoreductase [Lysobacter sp. ISL-54]MBT2780436.1 SDR family NAD(P)-dependent oxidoreductase [Lysobacter sp. ISL-52]